MEGYISEIRMFAGNFAPLNWAFCQGQTLQIGQHQALFSIVGTTYGGNGTTSFNLPDLRGRVPVGVGHGEGLTPKELGEADGAETSKTTITTSFTLTTDNLPPHAHDVQGDVKVGIADQIGDVAFAPNNVLAKVARDKQATPISNLELYMPATTATFNEKNKLGAVSHNITTKAVGTGKPFSANAQVNTPTLPPYLGINYIICLNGIYPSRPNEEKEKDKEEEC